MPNFTFSAAASAAPITQPFRLHLLCLLLLLVIAVVIVQCQCGTNIRIIVMLNTNIVASSPSSSSCPSVPQSLAIHEAALIHGRDAIPTPASWNIVVDVLSRPTCLTRLGICWLAPTVPSRPRQNCFLVECRGQDGWWGL